MTSARVQRETISPPMLARMLGVGLDKVHAWIKSGELIASNLATLPTQRPRWQVTREAVEQFMLRRANRTPTRRQRRKAQAPQSAGYVEFF